MSAHLFLHPDDEPVHWCQHWNPSPLLIWNPTAAEEHVGTVIKKPSDCDPRARTEEISTRGTVALGCDHNVASGTRYLLYSL